MEIEQIISLLHWTGIVFGCLFVLCGIGAAATVRIPAKPKVPKPKKEKPVPKPKPEPKPEKPKREKPPKKEKPKKGIPRAAPVAESPPAPEGPAPQPKKRVVVGSVPEEIRQQLDDLTRIPEPLPDGWIRRGAGKEEAQ